MARRRANGDGSIHQRKNGRWEGSIYLPTTSGIRKRVRVNRATRDEVREKLTQLAAQSYQGIAIPDKNWLLSDYLDHWLKTFVEKNRRPATFEQCRTIVRLYLKKPPLGERKLTDLTVPIVQAYLDQLLADGKSVSNVHVIRKVLSAALTRAQKRELMNRNVARLVDLPPEERKEITPWTVEELGQFMAVVRHHRLYPAYQLLFYGLRKGELLGLRWEDIDVNNRVIRIRQQLQRVGRQILIGPLKTTKSRRDLPLFGPVVLALSEHYEKHPTRTGLLFTTSEGAPIDPGNFLRDFKKVCKDNGLRVVPVHWMRHTIATLLKNRGVADRDIQLILGHSRITTTQEIYQHSDDGSRRSALQGLAGALLEPSDNTKTVQGDSSGLLVDVIDGHSCRQVGRFEESWISRVASIISGGAYRIRTDDLFHAMTMHDSIAERVTEVDRNWQTRRRHWMVGAVAAKTAVFCTRDEETDPAA